MASSTVSLESSTEAMKETRASSDSGLACGVARAVAPAGGRVVGATVDAGCVEPGDCVIAAGVALPVVHDTANASAGRRQNSHLASLSPASPAPSLSECFQLNALI
jgi:hypothetical protein